MFTDAHREKLAEYASAYGNNSGGVIVWGVSDKTRAAVPIQELKAFHENAMRLTSDLTAPVTDIQHTAVMSPAGDGTGFMVTFVPEAVRKPVQVVFKKSHQYWLRYGDSNITMTDPVVRAMMLANAVPSLTAYALDAVIELSSMDDNPRNFAMPYTPNYAIKFKIAIKNTGGVSAKDIGAVVVRKTIGLSVQGLGIVTPASQQGAAYRIPEANEPNQALYKLLSDVTLYPGLEVNIATATLGVKDLKNIPDIFVEGKLFADGYGGDFRTHVPHAIIKNIGSVEETFLDRAHTQMFNDSQRRRR